MSASCGKKTQSGGPSFLQTASYPGSVVGVLGWRSGSWILVPSLPQVHPMKKICTFSFLDFNFPVDEGWQKIISKVSSSSHVLTLGQLP